MKRLILFLSTSLFAMSVSPDYIQGLKEYLANKTLSINGTFYMYDFNKDGKWQKSDWLYIDNLHQSPFQLLGSLPSDKNPFGWKPLGTIPVDLNLSNPNGYFIFIDYPKDKELFGTNAFSWLYIPKDSQAIYKLMGAKSDHSFDYLDENNDSIPDALTNLGYKIVGSSITFISNSESSSSQQNEQPPLTCINDNPFANGSLTLLIPNLKEAKVSSGYRGDVVYDCKYTTFPEGWGITKDATTFTQIIRVEEYNIISKNELSEEVTYNGTITYDYAAQKVTHTMNIQSPSGNIEINCFEKHTKVLPTTIQRDQGYELRILMEDWGSGYTTLLESNCPAQYAFMRPGTLQNTNPTTLDMHLRAKYNITDSHQKLHTVVIERWTLIQKENR